MTLVHKVNYCIPKATQIRFYRCQQNIKYLINTHRITKENNTFPGWQYCQFKDNILALDIYCVCRNQLSTLHFYFNSTFIIHRELLMLSIYYFNNVVWGYKSESLYLKDEVNFYQDSLSCSISEQALLREYFV